MKSLHNFLVNNHVQKTEQYRKLSINEIKEGMYFAYEYFANDVLNTCLCVCDHNEGDHFWVYIEAYLHDYNPTKEHPVYINDVVYCKSDEKLRTVTDDEENLIDHIMDCYDEFNGNGNIIIGTIKDMKFRKRKKI